MKANRLAASNPLIARTPGRPAPVSASAARFRLDRTAWCRGIVPACFLVVVSSHPGLAQDKPAASGLPAAPSGLFEDRVLAKGKGVEVKQSHVDEAFVTFRANRAAVGTQIPEAMRGKIEAEILDKLISTQLIVGLATAEDKEKAKTLAQGFIAEQVKQASSEESFHRQLISLGMSAEQFTTQIHEQAVVKVVLDREVRATQVVTEEQTREFYEKNPGLFRKPEMAKVRHILFATQDPSTGRELSPEEKLHKRQLAEKVLERARGGETFALLAREFSDDLPSRDQGGEITVTRAKDDRSRAAVPEFEGAAFSLAPSQISDLVTTGYGYHLIKAEERIPSEKIAFAAVEPRIRETLMQDAVQKALPAFVEKLKKDAGVQLVQAAGDR